MSDESPELKVVDRRRFIQEGDNIKENPEATQLEAAERQAAEKAAPAEQTEAPKPPPPPEPPPAQAQPQPGTQDAEAPGAKKSSEQEAQERREAAQRKADQAAAGLPPADFTTVVEFLAQQVTLYLGEPDPMGRAIQPNLPAASLFIDLLGVLQEKTKGNLSLEENQVLDQILYALRLRYVQRRS
jgi:hypothetical protein